MGKITIEETASKPEDEKPKAIVDEKATPDSDEPKPSTDEKPKESKSADKTEKTKAGEKVEKASEPDEHTIEVVSSTEAEVISDDADTMTGVEPEKTPEEKVEEAKKASEKSAKAKTSKSSKKSTQKSSGRAMDMMPGTTPKPAAKPAESAKVPEIPTSEEPQPRFSKPKAILIAAGVALVVGIIGGVITWLMGRKEVAYCTVQFDTYGGSLIESEEVICGRKVLRPDDPTKEGFIFQGWVFEGENFDFAKMTVKDDAILVAKWQRAEGTETVTVRFNSNGGSEVKEREVAKGKKMTAPLVPIRRGYSFDGWYLDGKEFNFNQPIDKDITLTAHWVKDQAPIQPSSPDDNDKKAASISVAQQSIMQGDTVEVNVTIVPASAKYILTASSSDPEIASCTIPDDSKSKISCTAKEIGTATIKLFDEKSGKTATFKIEVTKKIIPVESVDISAPATEVTEGDPLQLSAIIYPEDATDTHVRWSVDNTSLATITSRGLITTLGAGTVTITVTVTTDNGEPKTNTFTLTIKPKVVEPPVIPATELTIDYSSDAMNGTSGGSNKFTATVGPEDTTDTTTWSSEVVDGDAEVATLASDGTITFNKAGTVTLTIKATAGERTDTKEITITVTDPTQPEPVDPPAPSGEE